MNKGERFTIQLRLVSNCSGPYRAPFCDEKPFSDHHDGRRLGGVEHVGMGATRRSQWAATTGGVEGF